MQEENLIESYYKAYYAKLDKRLSISVWGHFLFAIVFAAVHDTWSESLMVSVILIVSYYLAVYFYKGTILSQGIITFVHWGFASLYLYQMRGMYEMHFFYFLAATILVLYQSWFPQLPLSIMIFLHHVVLFIMHQTGAINGKEYLFNTEITIQILLLNLLVLSIHLVFCGWLGEYIKKLNIEVLTKTDSLEKQLKFVELDTKFAEQISQGNLKADFSPDPNDKLGTALAKMRDGLLEASQRDEILNYTNAGLAQISEIIRSQTTVKDLAESALNWLVNYTHTQQGYLFLHQSQGKESYLELISSFAFNRKKYFNKKILIGEGLVGQCFLEKETTRLLEIPEDYVYITSGIGEAPPRDILIVPVKTHQNVVGVLELASLQIYENHVISFIEKAAEAIATALLNIKIQENTQELLKQTQKQTEELRVREEELRQNMEELQTTQEELQRQKQEAEQITQKIEMREQIKREQLRKEYEIAQTQLKSQIQELTEKLRQAEKQLEQYKLN
ncbi:MAG: GAF domain-containing protein [Cytophagales bacterium]|nr:GAF domain-containing protein [Cytophagales bacterium]MDW8384599.1 GAF domain-containing protein [Flammeovirgaceae bacterium]